MPTASSFSAADDQPTAPPIDRVTVAAIAIVAYALANLLHEGLGHGGACLAVGCTPRVLSSMHFDGDDTGLSRAATNFIEAGGTFANLLGALLAFVWLRTHSRASGHARYFAWLFGTVNLLHATGYLLFSGVGNVGDWAEVVRGLQPAWAWRAAMTAVGGLTYWLSVRYALMTIAPFVGGKSPERYRRALALMLVPYFTGAGLYIVAGTLNPVGFRLVLLSAVSASLGGTSGFAWAPQLLRGQSAARADVPPTAIPRSRGWLALAIVVALIFVAVLGPGINLRR